MTNYEIIVAVVTGSSLARPIFENIKEYTVVVEAASPEEAEKKAMDTIAADKEKFDPMQHRIRIAAIKATDGSAVVYKDDDQIYRKLARALRPYRMWPYLERCKEFAQDYCVYSGVSIEEAAKMVAADPDVASSPAREVRGNRLTIAQQMLAEVKRQNAIRIERAQQPKTKTEKTAPAENQEPLYPAAGPERYHRMDPEVSRTMANLSKPEQTVRVDNEQSAKAAVNSLVGTFEHEDFYNFKEERIMNKKEMIKNSNAILMNIIDKKTNEEKHLFAEVFHILHTSDCYVDKSIDKPDTHVLVFHNEEGVLVSVNSAIEFGREIYTEIGQLVDETNAKAIRNRLTALFNSAKKTEETNPYQDMAKVPVNRWTLTAEVILQYLKPGEEKPGKFTVKRKITVVKVEDKFYNGYVYHSNGQYLGHWYWNVKYNRPSFKPNQDIGDYNRINYEYAIRKALRTIGLHSEYMPESADRYAAKPIKNETKSEKKSESRAPFTRKEIEDYFDEQIREIREDRHRCYQDSARFFIDKFTKEKAEKLAQFDRGEVFVVYDEPYTERIDGGLTDWSKHYYSDGHIETSFYGWSD